MANIETEVCPQFHHIEYERPDTERLVEKIEHHTDAFLNANNWKDQAAILLEVNRMLEHYETMNNLSYIRHTADTKDAFYEKEKSFYDKTGPIVAELENRWYAALLNTTWKTELADRFGNQLFTIAALRKKTISPDVIPLLEEENQLSTAYTKLKATAEIQFMGQKVNLPMLAKFQQSPDRAIRKTAHEAMWDFFESKSEEVEQIYADQIKIRTSIARKLGYSDFVGLGYHRMIRSDYDAAMMADFRVLIREYFVPLANDLYERQAKRLGIEQLAYYDMPYEFPQGNPKPMGDPKWIVSQAHQMYHELSPETGSFFELMKNGGFMDLVNRENKATGGYCTNIPEYGVPFIFSNFNGTPDDITVLTHEAGHAFQVYSSRNQEIREYAWPTMEACEIHSMGMEFFTYPWMDKFFGKESEKFMFLHLSGAIKFMPYGAAVDEFQHFVYSHPDCSKEERNAFWSKLMAIYLPEAGYSGHNMLNGGKSWQRQSHILTVPFYYIDYVLAQICAFQYWIWQGRDAKGAWNSYVKLCERGGSQPFLSLLKSAGLSIPFEESTIREISDEIGLWLSKIDDTKL